MNRNPQASPPEGLPWPAAALMVSLALTGAGCQAESAAVTGDKLNLSGYSLSFADDFHSIDIGAHPGARWTAHTPWSGDFGDAVFADPGPNGPFSKVSTGLRITARQGADGKWQSGLICSVDRDGPGANGFSQQYGYFEMRARLPEGDGVWPAFWLIGTDKSKTAAEIDVLEFYGRFPGTYHSVAHLWDNGKDTLDKRHTTTVTDGALSRAFNNYGVLIKPDTTAFYLNRREVWSIPTPPEYHQPMYILANLALGGGWPIDKLTSPQAMDIKYIHVFRADADQQEAR